MAIIITIAIVAIIFGIIQGLNTSYEDDENDKETSTDKTTETEEDFELDIRLREHKENLVHERETAKEKNRHQLITIGIVLPICLAIVVTI